MKTTITLSANLNCSPFDMFNQDTDEVIMLINFYLVLGATQSTNNTKTTPNATKKHQRIRVNDKTASGGWF